MPPALTHSECRFKLCLMCPHGTKGTSLEKIGPAMADRIREHYLSNFDPDNQKQPQAICGKHRSLLFQVHQKKKAKEAEKLPMLKNCQSLQ